MKGKTQKGVKAQQDLGSGFYAGAGSKVAAESKNKAEGFKRGGKAKHMGKVHGAAAMAHAGRKPRKSGGGVFSSAAKGTMRPGFGG
jgi:hypothetical protein